MTSNRDHNYYIYSKKVIIVNTGIGVGKSLIYQTVLLINLRAIVLTITSTIIFIEDQKKEFRQRSISIFVVISAAIKADPNLWKQLE